MLLRGVDPAAPPGSGVPDPYYGGPDGFTEVLEMVRPAASKLGLESPVELWGFFTQQCKQRLHVVLCFSPIGNAFRDRLRQNPSLVNCCTIDWFQVRIG